MSDSALSVADSAAVARPLQGSKKLCMSFASKRGEQSIILALDTSDVVEADVLNAIDHGRLYEHETSLLLLLVLNDGDVFVDVGANVGYFTALAGKLVGASGHVFAIEMNPRHLDKLRAHISINDIAATIIPMAIGREIGEMQFVDNGPSDGNGKLIVVDHPPEDGAPHPSGVTSVDTLDNVAARHPRLWSTKAIKIDVEGAEGWVLQGGAAFLRSERLELVIIEANPPAQKREFGVSFEAIRDIMLANGFHTYLPSETGGLPTYVPPDVRITFWLVANVAFLRPRVLSRYWPTVACLPARAIFKY